MNADTITATNVEGVLQELELELAALGDQGDVLLTYNAQAEFARKQSYLMGCLYTIRTSVSTLREIEPQVAALTAWRDHLVAWRADLSQRLAALVWPNDPARPGLEWSLQRIDRGLDLMNEFYPAVLPLDLLMAEAGYVPADGIARAQGQAWHGTLPQAEHRLKELTAHRDDARVRLDRVLAEQDQRRDVTRSS